MPSPASPTEPPKAQACPYYFPLCAGLGNGQGLAAYAAQQAQRCGTPASPPNTPTLCPAASPFAWGGAPLPPESALAQQAQQAAFMAAYGGAACRGFGGDAGAMVSGNSWGSQPGGEWGVLVRAALHLSCALQVCSSLVVVERSCISNSCCCCLLASAASSVGCLLSAAILPAWFPRCRSWSHAHPRQPGPGGRGRHSGHLPVPGACLVTWCCCWLAARQAALLCAAPPHSLSEASCFMAGPAILERTSGPAHSPSARTHSREPTDWALGPWQRA